MSSMNLISIFDTVLPTPRIGIVPAGPNLPLAHAANIPTPYRLISLLWTRMHTMSDHVHD